MTDEPWDFHIIRVEVTVAAGIQEPNGDILGRNMVDATLSFGWRTDAPPEGVSDEAVNRALGDRAISPVLALIQTALTFNGWVAMGQVDDPMTTNARTTGKASTTTPVRVHVSFPDEGAAVHD